MSSSVTEVAIFPLSSGANIEDPSSPFGAIWQASLNTIAGQKGFQRFYWGRQVENPNIIDFFVGNIRPAPLQSSESILIRFTFRLGILSGTQRFHCKPSFRTVFKVFFQSYRRQCAHLPHILLPNLSFLGLDSCLFACRRTPYFLLSLHLL